MAVQLFCSYPKTDLLLQHVLPFVGLGENRVVLLVENLPMTKTCLPHSCEDQVRKHLVEEPYVGNGAEIRHKFCASLFGKHREQCFFPFY